MYIHASHSHLYTHANLLSTLDTKCFTHHYQMLVLFCPCTNPIHITLQPCAADVFSQSQSQRISPLQDQPDINDIGSHMYYNNKWSAQRVHYQRMHIVSKVSKRFPTYIWEISWTPWKLRAFSGSVQVAHSLYSCI